MEGHHLILGELIDFLTGKTIEDTHDERLRQQVAKWLVQKKGYGKKDLESGEKIFVSFGGIRARVPLDFRITIQNRTAMIVKYGPGSILTRHRSALALSRLAAPYQIPVVVVTNGRDADVLEGGTGRCIGQGFEAIPSRQHLAKIVSDADWKPLPEKQVEMESRVLYAYEIDDACPCDNTVCRL